MTQLKGPTHRPSPTGVTHAALKGRQGSHVASPTAPGPSSSTRPDAFQARGGPSGGVAARPVGSQQDADGVEFDPDLPPAQVEALGNLHAAVHLVKRMHHRVASEGQAPHEAAQEAAAVLMGFARPDQARAVCRELERLPIYSVYPLQVQMALMEASPQLLPGWGRGTLVENRSALADGGRVLAGHACHVQVPTTVKLTGLALLSAGEPGYEFEPLRRGAFRLVVDAPGTWEFALKGSKGAQTLVDQFTVTVRAPGRVG